MISVEHAQGGAVEALDTPTILFEASKILTNSQPGIYLTGSSTVFNRSTAAQAKDAPQLLLLGSGFVFAEGSSFSGSLGRNEKSAYFLHSGCQFAPALQRGWALSTAEL